jgi:hypothetical protein
MAHPRRIDWLRALGFALVVASAVAFWVLVALTLAFLG